MHSVGLITYHAAYNFGSVLQAYATQQAISRLGYDCEIINYRLPNQLHYYGDVLTTRFGKRDAARRALCLLEKSDRARRAKRYERFISGKLRLSGEPIHTYHDLAVADTAYPVLIAGSDQVWNRHCTAEFLTEPPESIRAYFLDFQNGTECRRISFSSSISFMTEEEMREFVPLLDRFSHISMRERDGADLVSKLLGRDVINTIDPTLLLSREEWLALASEVDDEREREEYVLLYTLSKSAKSLMRIQRMVKGFAVGRRVVCISPFESTRVPGIIMRNDAGPLEFLTLLKGASFVVTDSFHGSAFSANLEIPFFSINTGCDRRKMQLLDRIGLGDRVLASYEALEGNAVGDVDFSDSGELIVALRDHSVAYLESALRTDGGQ